MLHLQGARLSDAVARKVGEIEAATDAEVVVVVSRCSGSYRDVAFAAASVASLVMFGVIIVIPFAVPPWMALADLVLTWAVAAWFVNGSLLSVRLAGAERRARQVTEAAAAAFHTEAVHATPRRLGILVYASAWEGQVELVPDVGIDARIPRGRWAGPRARASTRSVESFVDGLDAVGKVLAEYVPATEAAQVELSDAPRIRP